jgi:predicted acylesterase/phospholipase RssA
LAPDALEKVVDALELRELEAGAWCLREGDDADGLYVALHGRLEVVSAGEPRHELTRGDVFGELALLSGEPRSAGVRAVRDSEVVVLSAEAFGRFVEGDPGAVRQMARVVIRRLLAPASGPTARPVGTLGLLATPDSAGLLAEVARDLTEALAPEGPTVLVDLDAAPARRHRAAWAHDLEADHRFVVYVATPTQGEWFDWCRRQSDRVVVVADAVAGSPSEVASLLRSAGGRAGPGSAAPAAPSSTLLLLVHSPGTARPARTARWLHAVPVGSHLQLRRHHRADTGRVARLCTGRGVGLVLGGGGPRGLAHIGVLQALEDLHVPVDAVGGTSIGALVGSGYALGYDGAECERRTFAAIARAGRLFPPTLPVLSVSSPRKVNQVLEEILARGRAEDCWLPTFAVSANLSRAEVVVHERGPLVHNVRASIAIPGILPPVRSGGDLLVDGGVLDNLPVDVMRSRPGIGTVIAVDVGVDAEMAAPGDYRETASGFGLLADRLVRRGDIARPPTALEIMFRAKDLAARRIQMDLLAHNQPDLLLRPPVLETGMFDFAGARHLIGAAREHAVAELKEHGWDTRDW